MNKLDALRALMSVDNTPGDTAVGDRCVMSHVVGSWTDRDGFKWTHTQTLACEVTEVDVRGVKLTVTELLTEENCPPHVVPGHPTSISVAHFAIADRVKSGRLIWSDK